MAHKNILKITALAATLALIGCGGGGSDGYYNNPSDSSNTDTDNTTPPEDNSVIESKVKALKIELDKLSMSATNGQLNVTVRALDENKGGVQDADITLSIIDPTNNVSNLSVATQTTDASGNTIYTLTTPQTSSTISDLIKNGFKILVSTNKGELSQEQTINVTGVDNVDAGDTTSIVLFDATKTTLNVRGDQTTVTLTAVDANGATLANQAISLKVKNSALNGVKFTPNATQTDNEGKITYTLSYTEAQRSTKYSAEQFVQDDLVFEANFGQSTKVYTYKLDIVNSVVPRPVGAITVAYNPTTIQDSANGVYYYQNVSVHVTDIDGKPLANREVTMGINPTSYIKGIYAFVDTKNDPLPDEYMLRGRDYFNLHYAFESQCNSPTKPLNQNGKLITQLAPLNGKSVQVASYINSEGKPATDNKYTTDANGRFDLQLQYPKIYASWLVLQLSASTIVDNQEIEGTTSFRLGYLSADVDIEKGIAPNQRSPFGSFDSSCQSPN